MCILRTNQVPYVCFPGFKTSAEVTKYAPGVSPVLYKELLDVDASFLNDELLTQCGIFQAFREQVNLNINLTTSVTSGFVYVVLVMEYGNDDGLYEVMVQRQCTKSCVYEECQFGVKEREGNLVWLRFKCKAANLYVVRMSLLVNHTLLDKLCEVAIFKA